LAWSIVGRYQSMKDNVGMGHIESVASFVSACANPRFQP
jgi:hypothetical protein